MRRLNFGTYPAQLIQLCSLKLLLPVLPCSWAADRFGRKKVILLGTLGVAISSMCFGVSRTFPLLLLSRCLSGALGGVCA